MGQKEGPLALTKIASGSEYESKSKASTSSSLYISSSPTSPPPHIMSQYSQMNYKLLAQQQQEQLAALQTQIQALLTVQKTGGSGEASTEVAKPQVFDRTLEKVSGFIMACKLYIRIKMRGVVVEEQIQWILSYV